MDRNNLDVEVSYNSKFFYRLFILYKNILRIGIYRTLVKLLRAIYFKVKGVDFSPQELKSLEVVGENRFSGGSYSATNSDVLDEVIAYIDKIDKIRFKSESSIFNGVFIDYGCGKGRALYIAKNLGFKSSMGVEFAKELFEIANSNIKKLMPQYYNKEGGVNIILEDASKIKPTKDTTIIYFFNPFDEVVMSKVIDNILDVEYNRRVYIIYANPNLRELFLDSNFDMVSTHISPSSGDIVDIYTIKE